MSTLVNLRVPDGLLLRLRTVAKERGITLTALLLGPWDDGGLSPVPAPITPDGRTPAAMAKAPKQRTPGAAPRGRTSVAGGIVHKISGVQVGPVQRAPGSLAKAGKPRGSR